MDEGQQERFWAKVSKTHSCWEWVGAKTPAGYGKMGIHKITMYAHRLSYEHFCEPIPEGMSVLHKCDNPSCVNPEHLFVGTAKDNCQDMKAKDRHTRGERSATAKLTEHQVYEILAAHKSGALGIDLASKYRISTALVSLIINGERWSYLRA